WYGVKVQCVWDSSGRLASPSRVLQYAFPETHKGEALTSWRVDDSNSSYHSRYFRIRFARQDVGLREVACFHLPVRQKRPFDEPVSLRFELLHAPFTAGRGNVPPDDLDPVARQIVRIPGGMWHHVHEYTPVTFDTMHFAQLDVTVHAAMLHFSKPPLHSAPRPSYEEFFMYSPFLPSVPPSPPLPLPFPLLLSLRSLTTSLNPSPHEHLSTLSARPLYPLPTTPNTLFPRATPRGEEGGVVGGGVVAGIDVAGEPTPDAMLESIPVGGGEAAGGVAGNGDAAGSVATRQRSKGNFAAGEQEKNGKTKLADPATRTMACLLLESALLLRSLNAALAATYNLHHLQPALDSMAEQSHCSPVLASALRKLMGQSDREDGDRADADRERADVADADGADAGGADADRAGAKAGGVEASRSEGPGAAAERGASGSGEAAEGSEGGGGDCNGGDNGLKGRAQEREGEGVAVGGDGGGKQSGGGSGTVTSGGDGGDGVSDGVNDAGGGSREDGGKGELSAEDGAGSQVGKRDTTSTTGVAVTVGSVSITEEEVEAVKVAAKGLVTAYWTSFLSMHKLCHVELCTVLRQQWVANQAREAAPWVYASSSPVQTEQLFGLDRWPDVTVAKHSLPQDKQSDLALLSAALARQVRAAMPAVPSAVLSLPPCRPQLLPRPALTTTLNLVLLSSHHPMTCFPTPPHPTLPLPFLSFISSPILLLFPLSHSPSFTFPLPTSLPPSRFPPLALVLSSCPSPCISPGAPHPPFLTSTIIFPPPPLHRTRHSPDASFAAAAASAINASYPTSTFPSPPLPISPSLLPTTSTSLDSLLSSLQTHPPASIPFCLSSPHRPPISTHLNHLPSLSPAAAAGGRGTESPGVSGAGSTGVEGGKKATRGKHVVVFVHGYQGHRMDLRLVRDSWRLLDPDIECLMAESNETNSAAPHSPSPSSSSHSPARAPDLSGVEAMGARLAHEVVTALRSMFGPIDRPNRKNVLQRLSFVGYSIGNLVVRAALADDSMRPYLPYLHLYLSFCGPHLGYMYHSNSLVSGGMWLLKRLDPSSLMRQLSFSDSLNVRDSCIYRLSQLPHFPHILPAYRYYICPFLRPPPQDEYVPYHSARLEVFGAVLRDARLGGVRTSRPNGHVAPLTPVTSHHRANLISLSSSAFPRRSLPLRSTVLHCQQAQHGRSFDSTHGTRGTQGARPVRPHATTAGGANSRAAASDEDASGGRDLERRQEGRLAGRQEGRGVEMRQGRGMDRGMEVRMFTEDLPTQLEAITTGATTLVAETQRSPPDVDYLQELLAIQQSGPRNIGFFGTRNMGFMHQQLIEILSYAMIITVSEMRAPLIEILSYAMIITVCDLSGAVSGVLSGTRNMGFMHQQLTEILSYAMIITLMIKTRSLVFLSPISFSPSPILPRPSPLPLSPLPPTSSKQPHLHVGGGGHERSSDPRGAEGGEGASHVEHPPSPPLPSPPLLLAEQPHPHIRRSAAGTNNNHIYTSGAAGTNAAVIRGALRAEKAELLTVILPQSLGKQPPESQELLKKVENLVEKPHNDHLPLLEASRLCNMDILSEVEHVICFAFHDSRLLMETCQEAKDMGKIVTLFYLD
ncbi:unnamed protein product, partial [Closterium sp. Naga37s-1]